MAERFRLAARDGVPLREIGSNAVPPRRPDRITIPLVKSLRPGDTIWDSDVRGFGVRRQRRDPVYVLKTRIDGRQRLLTIGTQGKGWTVDSARREAARLLGLIAAGTDRHAPVTRQSSIRR
jgi:hypothetical protein